MIALCALVTRLLGEDAIVTRRENERSTAGSVISKRGRALELLLWIGGAEAKQVLEDLARGAPGAWLTLNASAALKRVKG